VYKGHQERNTKESKKAPPKEVKRNTKRQIYQKDKRNTKADLASNRSWESLSEEICLFLCNAKRRQAADITNSV